ncbi:family 43 glycosylhydrolase [Micromonospora sp. CPCC 205561]|uniref:family 43 glycosylhydrolase n=1 Tax=Micromonospora sp. CPCC 205561 TaxID=3122407 RepID=UPI002FF01027
MTRPRPLAAVVGVLAFLLGALTVPQPASAATTLIYTTFKGDGAADQELWVYQSTDGGTSYSVLHDTNFRGPTGVLRDPSIIKREGTYYVAYTWQSWTTNSTYFAVARSTDLRNWTNIATVPSGIPGTRNVWAPEFYVEGSAVRVVVSVRQTTNPSGFRPYVYTAQNPGLTSWSGPQQMGGLGHNYIDTYVVRSGSTYHAFTKNESTKYIERWTSNSLTSGWTRAGTLWSSGYEGPSLVRLDDGRYRIYVDRYTNGGVWTATSSNLTSWTGLSLVGCSGCRHGTAIPK